jgi:hypothetical protein
LRCCGAALLERRILARCTITFVMINFALDLLTAVLALLWRSAVGAADLSKMHDNICHNCNLLLEAGCIILFQGPLASPGVCPQKYPGPRPAHGASDFLLPQESKKRQARRFRRVPWHICYGPSMRRYDLSRHAKDVISARHVPAFLTRASIGLAGAGRS